MKPRDRLLRAWWNVPLGWQLGSLYAGLLVTILLAGGTLLYTQLDSFLVANTAARLRETARPLLTQPYFPSGDHGPNPAPYPASPSRARQDQVAGTVVRRLSGPDVSVVVLDETGQVISSTAGLAEGDALPTLPTTWQQTGPAGPPQWIAPDPAGGRRLVLIMPLDLADTRTAPAQRLYIVQVAALGAADAVLDQMRLYLALGILGGTLLGVLAGLGLTRLVVRPLNRLAGTAEAIAGGDLTRRLRLPPGRNEVARLGHTFDHMVDRLAATLEVQRRFVADASHELRTPLTSLEGLSELLLLGADRGDASTIQRSARAIHSELGRLGRLVGDLLTLSRLDSTLPLQRTALDARLIVQAVAEQITPLAAARQIQLQVAAPEPLPITGDADRLKQVLINLLDNAMRYTPAEGTIWLRGGADGPGGVRLEVEDTGPGIAPDDLPHIFDRFYRGDLSRARATGTTGLGLAIAQAIIAAQGGTLAATSPPGRGACFTVRLPRATAPPPGGRSLA